MRISPSGNKLVFHDFPGCFQLVALSAIALGILSAVVAFGLTPDTANLAAWQKTLIFALSMSIIAIGVYAVYEAPGTSISIDPDAFLMKINRRSLLRREMESYLFSEIQEIYTVRKEDLDGFPVYSLRMRVTDGKEVALTSLWFHNLEKLNVTVNRLKECLTQETDQS